MLWARDWRANAVGARWRDVRARACRVKAAGARPQSGACRWTQGGGCGHEAASASVDVRRS